jgi:hypothetical protein
MLEVGCWTFEVGTAVAADDGEMQPTSATIKSDTTLRFLIATNLHKLITEN